MTVAVAGWGSSLPRTVVGNADLERRLDTTDAWITERTGIRSRHLAGPDESSVDLAVAAGADALDAAGVDPADVDLLIVATVTPAQALPGNAAFVQERLGLGGGAFDLNAACAGFVYALVVAARMLRPGGAALVIGTETLSRIVDPDDRATAVLFGDAAAAVTLVAAADDTGGGLVSWDLGCDGSAARFLEIPPGERWLRMDGGEVFRRAVRAVVGSAGRALQRAELPAADVDLFVPHQANVRIIDAAAGRLGIAPERVMVNLDRYGNTSAASIPLALAEAADCGRLRDGDAVLLSGFGAGMTWASAVLRWGRP